MTATDTTDHKLAAEVSRLLNIPVASVANIGTGRNSRVYRIICDDGSDYTAKLYYGKTMDNRSRLDVEFSGLNFLRGAGVRCVPEPVVCDEKNQLAIYRFIDGRQIGSDEVGAGEIDQCLSFVKELKELARANMRENLWPAAEACFSAQDIIDNLVSRLDLLNAIDENGGAYQELKDFLHNRFAPALETISNWATLDLEKQGGSATGCLPDDKRTLSPSDFGFHNALLLGNGRVVFLDFEYFGWDDPAKLISDFLLHPAMKLDRHLNDRFAKGAVKIFESDSALEPRLKAVYPLFGLKWILIMLNVFIPEYSRARGNVADHKESLEGARERQLHMACSRLDHVVSEYQAFPFDL